MPTVRDRILIALASGAAASAVAWIVLRGRTTEDAPPVTLVDTVRGLGEAFAARDATPDEPVPVPPAENEAPPLPRSTYWAGRLDTAATGEGTPGPRPRPGGIPRLDLTPKVARNFFPAIGKSHVFDPDLIARHRPSENLHQLLKGDPPHRWRRVTNELGLREDTEVLAEKPDARVLVVGDSHVDGVCNNRDSFPNVLEAALAGEHPDKTIEVLNGGTGGWSFYNYLGALEGFAALAPDVFVVTVYGGNDFYDAVLLHHYHRREPMPLYYAETVRSLIRLAKVDPGTPPQYYNQVAYFHDHEGEEAAALSMAIEVTGEIARQCAERGIALLVVYLPPYAHGQPDRFEPHLERAQEFLPMSEHDTRVDERLADAWLAALGAAGIRTVDLRPAFRAAEDALYFEADHHINLGGQRLLAATVHPVVARLAGLVP